MPVQLRFRFRLARKRNLKASSISLRCAILWHDETMGAKYDVEEIPADMLKKAEAFRMQLVESVAETDDGMLHKFLEGETPTADELRAALRRAVIGMQLFP